MSAPAPHVPREALPQNPHPDQLRRPATEPLRAWQRGEPEALARADTCT